MIRKFYDAIVGEPSSTSQDAEPATKGEVKEVVGKLMEKMEESFKEKQEKPFQYVVAYFHKDKFLGYHADTFCTLTQKKENGKRYNGENPYGQLSVIRKNLDYTLDMTQEKAEGRIFASMNLSVKNRYFKDMNKEDVFIEAEYLDDNIPPQRFVWKEITE